MKPERWKQIEQPYEAPLERGRGTLEKEKPPVLGLIERGGQVVLRMLPDVKQRTIKPIITETVAPGATDDRGSIRGHQ